MILVLDNEVQPDYRVLAPEIARMLGDAEYHVIVDDPDHPPLERFDGVVLSGSTDSVYADDHGEWFDVELDIVEQCIEEDIPLLGDCYGHQLVNYALGGRVESDERRATFVEMTEYDDSPAGVLEGVDPVVPVLHGDLVVELGDGMESVARTAYDPNFCSRHRDAPVWTVQFHPELVDHIAEEVDDWDPGDHSFEESTAPRVLENFARHCGVPVDTE
jgi:GMP synthase (glutamine-hydrolysing)